MTRLKLLIVLVFVLVSGFAQSDALALWELQGTKNRIMLLGSVHYLRADDYPLASKIDEAYRNSDTLIMEIDLDDMDPMQAQLAIMQLAADPDGKQLKDMLGAAAYDRASKMAAEINISMAILDAFEPWYGAIVVTQLTLMQLGFDPNFGVDSRLAARAMQDRKEIRGLETLEYQLGVMDGMSISAQRDFLLATLDEAGEVEEMVANMITAWKSGNTRALESLIIDTMAEQPELYQRMLVDRNRNWTKIISQLTKDSDDYLIVVGTGHLVGKDSVLAMLDKAGYPSKQIQR